MSSRSWSLLQIQGLSTHTYATVLNIYHMGDSFRCKKLCRWICLHLTYWSLLAILWNSAFRCLYLSFSPLLFASLLFTAICKASPDSHFAFLHFFSMGMVLIPVFCTMSRTSVHSSSGTLSDLDPKIYFSLPLYNHKGFDLGHTWMVEWFSLLSSISVWIWQ